MKDKPKQKIDLIPVPIPGEGSIQNGVPDWITEYKPKERKFSGIQEKYVTDEKIATPAAEGGQFGRLLEACILLERSYNGEDVRKEIGEFLYEP